LQAPFVPPENEPEGPPPLGWRQIPPPGTPQGPGIPEPYRNL
jgi:hypothetical protein